MNKNIILIIGYLLLIGLGYKYLLIREKAVDNNRFELHLNPNVGKFQYLLDKQQGKVWQAVVYTDIKDQPMVWEYRQRIDNDADLLEFYRSKHAI